MAKNPRKPLSKSALKELREFDAIVFTRSKVKKFFVFLLILILIAVVGIVSWKYAEARNDAKQAQEDAKRLSDPNVATKNAEEELTKKVQKLALVPTDEKPTIADVKDASKINSQALFALVENGDKWLYYSKSRRLVIFRPSTNQVVTIVKLPEGTDAPTDAQDTTPNNSTQITTPAN